MIVEFFVVVAVLSLLWLIWQLMRAKHFTKFKQHIEHELKPKVVDNILTELEQSRSEAFPNTKAHQEATILYWSQSKARILQAALAREIIDEAWLRETGNWRNSQHLFHIEQHLLHR